MIGTLIWSLCTSSEVTGFCGVAELARVQPQPLETAILAGPATADLGGNAALVPRVQPSRQSGRRAARRYEAGNPALEEGDTIYLTVADKDRNMVSLIQSNYRGFGSGMCPPGLGFCLQDRGELFDMNGEHVEHENLYNVPEYQDIRGELLARLETWRQDKKPFFTRQDMLTGDYRSAIVPKW